ncbi:MAG: allantoinase AllB [Gemmatimonadaceae bacterium]
MTDTIFRGERVVLPGGMAPAAVAVAGGRIQDVQPLDAASAVAPHTNVVDLKDAVLLPGLVDTHVHVNEPGRTEWEGFRTATRAAAAGGVTTLLDMPLNCIPATTTASALGAKLEAARGQCCVDVGFIGGIVPHNAADLPALHAAGVLAWKAFLVDSGVREFPPVDEAALRRVLPDLARWDLPLMVHAELPEAIAAAAAAGPRDSVRRYVDYAATRPERAECEAVDLLICLSEASGARIHIVHVSSAGAVRRLRDARARDIPISGETCPHYLFFAAESVPDDGTAFKCAPPIRSGDHREALWRGLLDGDLRLIVSDHSPAPPALKRVGTGDWMGAWGGIGSLELGLRAVWTAARRTGEATSLAGETMLPRIAQWMATAPGALVRLTHKGRIAPGCDADFVVFEPDVLSTVDAARLNQRHAISPYHGLTLAGRVRSTYLRGELIYDNGEFVGEPRGRLIRRD